MTRLIRRISDFTGEPESDGVKAGKLIIRRGPGITPGKPLVADVLPHEVANLADAPHMYLLEYRGPDAKSDDKPVTYMVSTATLQELIDPSGKRVIEFLRGLGFYRGRERGTRVRRRRSS